MKRSWTRPALVGLALCACLSTSPTEIGLGEEFMLAPNQSVRIIGTNLTVALRRVVADNRCPLELSCVVEGAAGVELDVFGSSATNPVVLDTHAGSDAWSDGTYELRLLDVLPSPSTDASTRPEEYRARLVVELVAP